MLGLKFMPKFQSKNTIKYQVLPSGSINNLSIYSPIIDRNYNCMVLQVQKTHEDPLHDALGLNFQVLETQRYPIFIIFYTPCHHANYLKSTKRQTYKTQLPTMLQFPLQAKITMGTSRNQRFKFGMSTNLKATSFFDFQIRPSDTSLGVGI